jgi:hypothetical protein
MKFVEGPGDCPLILMRNQKLNLLKKFNGKRAILIALKLHQVFVIRWDVVLEMTAFLIGEAGHNLLLVYGWGYSNKGVTPTVKFN